MTYNAFAHLSPLSDTYELKDNFNSESNTEAPETSSGSDNPFAHLSPLSDTYAVKGGLAPVVQTQPERGEFDSVEVSPEKQGWGELGGWKNLADGSVSTEITITVKHPELNRGMPTVIPTLVSGQEDIDGLLSFNITDQHEEIAVKRAIQRQNDGQQWPSFETLDEADNFAQERSNSKGAENDSPNSAITDFILRDEDSFAGRVNRGIAGRVSTLGGGLVRFVGQSADELGDWLEEKVPLGMVDIGTDGISWRPSTKEDIAQPSFLLPLARDMESADFGYKEGTTWEEVKSEPLANILPWALETGLVSAPDMAAAIIALPAYIAARTGEMGQNRAENKGEKDATFQEFLEVLPASVGSAILERIGASKVFGISTPVQSIAEVPKEIAKRVLTDSAVEGVQEPLEYAAETIGTNVEFEPAVAAERALQGALSGAVTASALAPLTIPGELALADAKKTDGGPQANSDGSSGTPNPALISSSATTGEWGVFPNVGGSYSVLNPATGENAGTFDSEQEAELVYQSKVVETPPQKPEPVIPDVPTSEAPDIAEVEVEINAQRAELDNDLAKALASLSEPLTSSIPPTTELLPPPTIVAVPKDEPEADPLAITPEDMAQIDIDTAAYEARIAATNTELAPTLPEITPEAVELLPESLEIAPAPLELPPELPVAPVKKKLLSETQKAAQRKEIDPTKDDLLVAIAKMGGVTRAEASSEGFDTPDFKLRKGFGGQVVFRAKAEEGKSFDAMREVLSQYGYIDPDSTVNDFTDLLQKAVRGETVVSTANESYLAEVDAARDDDYIQQGGVIDEVPAPANAQDRNITSALEEARTLGLPENEIDSILTNYPKESDAVLQLQMSMGDIELGDSSVTTNQAARVGDLRPERNVPKSAGDQGLAGQRTNDGTGQSDNGTQDGTDEVGVLLSPSATSGDTNTDSEEGSGGGSDSAGLSGTNAGETVPLEGSTPDSELTISPSDAKDMKSLDRYYGGLDKQQLLSKIESMEDGSNEKRLLQLLRTQKANPISDKSNPSPADTLNNESLDNYYSSFGQTQLLEAIEPMEDSAKKSYLTKMYRTKYEKDNKAPESFDLETQSEESLAADTEQAATANAELAAKTKTLSDRAQADADLDGFLLTGSDAPADIAMAHGQDDIFGGVEQGDGVYSNDDRNNANILQEGRDTDSSKDAQLDLFNEASQSGVPSVTQTEQLKDNFNIHYKQVEVGTVRSGIDVVNNEEEAAHVFAPFRKHAQETFLALVTDKDGKILNLIRHTKGGQSSSSVYVTELAGAVTSTKGAANVWFAHNHPSGNSDPSDADKNIQRVSEAALEGTGITPRGHVVVAPGGKMTFFKEFGGSANVNPKVNIKPLVRSRSIPVTERVLRKRNIGSATEISSPVLAQEAAAAISAENALLLLDNKHVVIGSLAFSVDEMATLREGGQVNRILSAMANTNAAAVIIKASDKDAATNLSKFFNRPEIDTRLLDWVFKGKAVELRSYIEAEGPFFSKSAILAPDAKPKGVTKAQIQARVDVFLAKYKGAGDVRVWVRDTQDNAFGPGSTAKDGRIKGGYYPEQDAVVFIAENIDSLQDIDSTIQHELLVHKGLGLFEAKDVQGLVDVINENAANSKTLKDAWAEVQDKYKKETLAVQAEELLARVAEKKMSKPDKYWNKVITFIRDMLRKIGFVKEISFSDLRKRVYDMGAAFAEGRRANTREGFTAKTNDTKSPSSDGLSGSKRFDSKKGKDTIRPNPSLIDMSKRPDAKVKVDKGNGKPDLTIYGVNDNGTRVLVAKPRAGGWDIIVDRRADGELFADGKPREYTAQNRKQVEERVKMLGLEVEEVLNKKPPSLPPIEGELLNDQPEWTMPDATWLDEKIFLWQDRLIAADKARKAIEKFNGERLADDMRVYEIETLAHGKAAAQLDNFHEKTLKPLQNLLSKNDLSMDDVSQFLYARHAKEANAAMKAKDGDRTENDALSGMTNENAAKILADFKVAGKMDALNQIAQVTDGIIERSRKLLVRTGLESESTVQRWRNQYEFYSPLWGDPSDPEGTNRREEESKKRLGRRSRADNVYINLIVQHEQTIVRAERNYLYRSLLKMAQENPNQDFFTINKPETKRVEDPVTELFMDKEIAPSEFPSNVVPITVDGEKFLVQFNDENFHSSMFAHVMNTAAGSDITGFIKFAHLTSRWVSTVNTQFNLEFLPNNFMKDFQTALINLHQYAELSGPNIAQIAGNVRASIKGIREHQKGNTDGEMAVWYERFKNAGAQTGWLDNYDSMAERGKALQTMINRDKHVSLDAAHRLVEYVSDMNTAYENGIRFSSFRFLVEELGFTEQRAAFAVKNLTVNFNQKGEKSITANALYVFFKSSMNGTANIARAVQSKRVRKVLYKMLGFSIGLNVLNQLLSGEDEDGQSAYSKIPLYIRDNNWVFLLPDMFGEDDVSKRYYITIPLSYGYNVVPVAGNIIADSISALMGSEDYRKGDSFSRMLGAFIHGYNPMGSTGGLAQFLTPTVADPLAQIFENKNFAGNPIAPEQIPFGPPKPNSQLSWKRTPEPLKDAAIWLNDVSGGDDVRPGNLDVSPEWMKIYWDFLAGGTGRFLSDLVGTPVKAILGEEWSVRDVPFLRKVIKQVGNSTDQSNFYAALDDIEYAMRDQKAAKESDDDARIDQVDEDYGHLIGLAKAAKSSRNQVSQWKDEIKLFEEDDNEDNEYKQSMIDDLNKDIRSEMMMFVREYYDAVELAEDY